MYQILSMCYNAIQRINFLNKSECLGKKIKSIPKYGKDNSLSMREAETVPWQKLALTVSELWLEVT